MTYDNWKLASPDYDEVPEDACPECGGTGRVYLSPCYYPCSLCEGTGHYETEPEIYPIECEDCDPLIPAEGQP